MTMNRASTSDLTRITLQVLCIGILIAATFWIMRPFLLSLIWAVMIVVATWPFMLKVEGWLWKKRGLAVSAMTIVMLILFIVPFSLAIVAIIENADDITAWVKSIQTQTLPTLPGWLSGLPVVGPKLTAAWESIRTGPEGVSARLVPYAGKLLTWFLSQAGSVGIIAVQLLLTVIIAAICYANGETASTGVLRFARRLGGYRSEEAVDLAARTIRGVALGVVGTALIQSLLGGIGLAVTGVPAAAILTAVMFMLCIAQLGPGLVLIPSVIWLYWSGQTIWGTVLLVVTIFVSTFDNFLRPILIKKGADLPLLLIFAGVIGGLVAFGIVGLFIGPVVLAVTFRLVGVWVADVESSPASETAGEEG
ncbi:Predicted PurR-regulated permease PerM [Syntrophus gentianae]|uniref:Predicted PurR-regulated permease PerM n=1 Tax=Syntrophus gentianae TaxID=43775 RepID=A0A1H7VXN7_9BACT|nr:AI-2E family transporter YdiK [Syntrophus gentianae]SEM13545.1 Predicted PurR-regulated permease PerM [Syntrophus gentianae]